MKISGVQMHQMWRKSISQNEKRKSKRKILHKINTEGFETSVHNYTSKPQNQPVFSEKGILLASSGKKKEKNLKQI